ncbi:phosphoribosylanthranilate isomerase [Flavobacterium sp. 123]|uniref:phosphoribosylanthranilate isomerase n=1 Tax=Flavobacterium sp. 123 TaxID=2135627 RepID=UPI001F3C15A5|nr:phosphoribosylanthranilate isomerase [Flavobacterium sp. 123]
MKKDIDNQNILAHSPSGRAGVGIKICGMKYPDNIVEIGALLPDYMGFIFWEKSARYFDGTMPDLPKSIKKVGVFVNESTEVILAKAQKYNLQAIQLHGQESVAFCSDLKSKMDASIEIIKVFSVSDSFDFRVLEAFETVCDYFLFDTKGKLPGGNGTTFDWKVLENYPSTKPFFLSGGIGIEEIKSIQEISKTNLPIYAIDINSKFEIESGLKNEEKLKRFINNLKL